MTGPSLRDLDGHDPYALLGVPSTATRAEIVAAHRKQVQLVHPDRPGGSEYETKLLHVAKDVLLDPRRRAEYDASRAQPADPPPSAWDEEESAADPPETLWDSEEVVSGAGPTAWDDPPYREPPTASHWDEPAPSHWDEPPPYWDQPPPPRWQPPPPRWGPPPWQPPDRSVSALSIVALVCAVLCWCAPLGLILGLKALGKPRGPNDRAVALIAVGIGAVVTFFLVLTLLSR
ncbi:DnaJ domain-containing protein [Saccharothrix variisporea]|uniref:DnaJ-like protein n=1 Tax=Saccharothrix variisporea TaxID=543527 RepID=A0A495X2U0_9PSEU|nr:DnaJ domain-containing protein [Saccharothrix variisporea]RKT67816.1 DnaJ-like protein [Saccharothrix variisporea]